MDKIKKTILLVEDEALIAMAETKALKKYGYSIVNACDAAGAIEAARADRDIDLILMDIDLGRGMDGTGAAEIILKERDIPVVFLSSHTEPEMVERTEKITSYGYVVKNTGITVLDASIKMAFKLFDAKMKEREQNRAMAAMKSRLEGMLNALPDLMFEVGLDGRYHSVHSRSGELLAAPAEDLVGKRVADILPPGASAVAMAAIQEANETGVSMGHQYRLRLPGGNFWFELSVSRQPAAPGEEPRFICLARDITGRKEAEEALRLQAMVLDQIKDYVTITDLDGVITYVNQAVVESQHRSRQEILGMATELYGDDSSRGATQREILESTLRDGSWRGEVVNYGTDGMGHVLDCRTQVVHDDMGAPVALCGISTDITEYILMEKAQRESEELFKTLFEQSPVGIARVSSDGRFMQANSRFCDIIGYTEEEVHGLNFKDITHPDDLYLDDENIARVMDGEMDTFDIEKRYIHKNGHPVWIKLFSNAVRGDDGTVRYAIATIADITERKLAEEELTNTLNATTDGIWTWNFITGALFFSPRYYTMLGYKPFEFPASFESWRDLIHPQDIERALGAAEVYLKIKPEEYENEFRMKTVDGRYRWIHAKGRVVRRDRAGKAEYMIGNHEDITQRKEAEEKLRASQTMLRHILDTIPQSVFWKDRDGVYLGCNRAFAGAAGMANPADIIGMTDFDLPWSRAEAEAYRADDRYVISYNRPKYHIIEEGRKPDGSRILADTMKMPLRNPDGSVYGILGVYQDITERRHAEDRMRLSEERFRQISAITSDIAFSCRAGECGGFTIDWISGAVERITGYSAEEILSQGCWRFMVAEDDISLFEKNVVGLAQGSQGSCELRLVHKNGDILWVSSTVHCVGDPRRSGSLVLFGGLKDITGRRHAEEELRAYKQMVSSSPDSIALVDRDYRYRIINDAYVIRFGLPREKILGRHVAEILGDNAFNEIIKPMFDRALAGETVHYAEWFQNAEGRRFMDVAYSPCRREDSSIIGVMGIIRDITGQKRAEGEIATLLKEKELLLQEVHHRIKNNLSSIAAMLELQTDESGDGAVARALGETRDRVWSMSLLYDRIYRDDQYDHVSVGEYLPDLAIEIVRNFPAGETITIDARIDDFELDMKKAFPLGIILYELITNAMKYAFAGRESGLITLSAALREGRAVITIGDNGTGMPQADAADGPAGFGLRLVKLLVKQIGGTMKIESGGGTRFIIEFSCVETDRKRAG